MIGNIVLSLFVALAAGILPYDYVKRRKALKEPASDLKLPVMVVNKPKEAVQTTEEKPIVRALEEEESHTAQEKRLTTGVLVALAGAGLVIIAGALSWAKITSVFGTIGMSGFQVAQGEPGIFSLIFGVLGILAISLGNLSLKTIACFATGGLTLLYDLFMYSRINDIISTITSQYVVSNIGEGLFLSFAGSVLVLIGGVLILSEKEQKRETTIVKEEKPTLGAPTEQVFRVCPSCGKILTEFPPDIKKCPYCGKDLTATGKSES